MTPPIIDQDPLSDADTVRTVSPFELFRVIWRRRLLVTLVAVLCTLTAVLYASQATKEYTASASLLFRDPGFSQALYGSDLFQTSQDPKRAAQTNIDVVHSRNVANVARARLNTTESADSLLDSVSVTPSSDSDVATVQATRATAAGAAAVANAFASGYIAYRESNDRAVVANAASQLRATLHATTDAAQRASVLTGLRQLDELRTLQTGNAEVIATAQLPAGASSPRPKRDALFGLLLGLLAGCGIALLIDYLDRRLQNTADVERAYSSYQVIANVPRHDPEEDDALGSSGPSGEAYRMLREGLRFLDPDQDVHCIVVTSADESEGKSTVARSLALTLAAVGQTVILMEADMRRPTAAAKLGIRPGTAGLSDLLVSREPVQRRLTAPLESSPTLAVLPSGTVPPNPADLLRTKRAAAVLSEVRELADIVVIDAPPLLPVSDTRVLLQMSGVDAVVMVARVGVTRRDRAHEAQRVLHQSGRRVLGLVVTETSDFLPSSYYDGQADRPALPQRALRAVLARF